MNTREQAWVYANEHPTDILIVGKMKREPNGIGLLLNRKLDDKFTPEQIKENLAFDSLAESEKDALNEKYLTKHGL